ncbi:MAG: hypothetical protein SOR94_01175 [Lawsonella sp.]|uniref:hypothetical protein n=1 Tax=Lawsonella sp. TaxID=2041415 RepID=UPI002A749A24|nr:hypothetical protein [Lawsonella sp.]MDY2978638.1 hypothetical protein [Lawsonella sp.]
MSLSKSPFIFDIVEELAVADAWLGKFPLWSLPACEHMQALYELRVARRSTDLSPIRALLAA